MNRRTIAALVLLLGATAVAHADMANCQKQILGNLLKYKKSYLKAVGKCLDNENVGKIAGPCPDAASQLKIQSRHDKIVTKLGTSCTAADLSGLGFPGNCAYETTATGIEATCAALPAGTPAEVADCLMCWKGAQLATYVATLYASHANEVCGGALDETSSACRELDCAMPLPDQRNLGASGENDCQRAIGKAGIKHLVSLEKVREKCGLAGNTQAECDVDLTVQAAVDKSKLKLEALIKNKCGNGRDPVPSPPFCCKIGTGNSCSPATDRTDCTDVVLGTVQEGKTCNAGSCDPAGGGGSITWWSTCPRNDTCTNDVLTLDDLITCVDASADESAAAMLCVQFPTGWSCPPDAP